MKIAVCIPSRGLIHSRTVEAVWRVIKKHPEIEFELFQTHDQPIPDCFNTLVDRALDWDPDYILFVEEDMVPDPNLLQALLDAPGDVRAADYKMDGGSYGVYQVKGEDVLNGMGFMLVPVYVFKKLQKPYFKTNIEFTVLPNGDLEETTITAPNRLESAYGLQDMYFCWTLKKAGFKLTTLREPHTGHLRIIEKNDSKTNQGAHKIEEIQ